MINNYHKVELYLDDELVEFGDDGIDIKLSETYAQPTKLTASTASYSYSFNIPATPHNNRLLGSVNVLERKNKFQRRYKAVLYADNVEIFNGLGKISSLSENKYKMNLYVNKLNTIDSIFGDATMDMIDWKVPFVGNATINEVNRDMTTKYFFPWVAYALPMKKPYNTTGSGVEYYTDKKTIDQYTKFYYNSFVPSLNMVEVMKRCFEYKGLTLQGDVVTDDILNAIYLSNYIKDDQDPAYNYGNDSLGDIKLSISWSNNYKDSDTSFVVDRDSAIQYDMDESMLPIGGKDISGNIYYNEKNYTSTLNWDTFFCYNLLDRDAASALSGKTFMLGSHETQIGSLVIDLQNDAAKQSVGDGAISIPQDGWYEITVDGYTGIDGREGNVGGTGLSANSFDNIKHVNGSGEIKTRNNGYSVAQFTQEFQLLRYRPDEDNDENDLSHNPLWGGMYPNEAHEKVFHLNELYLGRSNYKVRGTAMCDPYNNPNYVCGWMLSQEGAHLGYIKNGGSWNGDCYDTNEALYNCDGYYKVDLSKGSDPEEEGTSCVYPADAGWPKDSTFNSNSIKGYTNFDEIDYNTTYGYEVNGKLRIIVKLNRNDILIPYVTTHGLPDAETYDTTKEYYKTYRAYAKLNFEIRPLASSTVSSNSISYGMPVQWGDKLNLANFLNSEQKMSEFIGDVQKAFNLSFTRNGNTCVMNLNKQNYKATVPIDLDSRYNVQQAELESIDWPSEIQVEFNCDTEEEGFYRSVPDSHINDDDWEQWGEKGSESIPMSVMDDASALTQTVGFSYDWFLPFKVMDFSAYRSMGTSTYYTKYIPVIGKSEWWIEDYEYAEMRQHDGRSEKQRFWFRTQATTSLLLPSNGYVRTDGKDSLLVDMVYFCTPDWKQTINGETIYLNYKYADNTLLGKFFNIDYDSRNDQLTVETYITPQEYNLIGKGCSVKLNDDLYRVTKISSYNPETGKMKAELLSI